MTRVWALTHYLGAHSNWVSVVSALLLIGGGITSPIVSLHWLARLLIAIGLILVAVVCVLKLSADRLATAGQRVTIAAIGILALIAAIDEDSPILIDRPLH